MGNQSSAKLSKTVVVASARMAVPAGCVLAWVFVVFLSAALYQGNQSVGSATLSTVFCSLCFFGTLAVVLALFGMQRLVERKRELYAIGAVLIIAASVLPVLPFFSGLHGWFAPMIVGCLSGAGLALISLFFIAFVAGMAFAAAVVWYLLSLAIGIGLYLLYMVVASGGFANSILWVLPAVSAGMVFVLLRWGKGKPALSSAYARSLARSQLRGMFDHRAFAFFTVVSGFLFGYCYNIYPKSTRFAGAYTETAIGFASPAAITLLVTCLAIVGVLVLVGRLAKNKSAYVLGSLLLVALAFMYFSLPNMPNNWMLFVLLDSAAISTTLFVLLGAVMRFSQGDRKRFGRCLLSLSASVVAGSSVAALFIETTVPQPMIQVPEPLRDAVIVGTPAIGFIVLALIFFLLAQEAFFPAATGEQPDAIGVSDLGFAGEMIAKRFSLTPREEEILGMLLLGRSGPYISEDLYLSKSTVKTHIRHIYDKTGVSSRQELIDLAHSMRGNELRQR